MAMLLETSKLHRQKDTENDFLNNTNKNKI